MIRALLASALLFTASSARADWREASTAHFVVYSQQSADQLTRFANQLERFDTAIRRLRGAPEKPIGRANRVTVYVVDKPTWWRRWPVARALRASTAHAPEVRSRSFRGVRARAGTTCGRKWCCCTNMPIT